MSRETLAAITKSVSIPIVAIGGITYDNMDSLKDTGVAGVSVISAILQRKTRVRRLRHCAKGGYTVWCGTQPYF